MAIRDVVKERVVKPGLALLKQGLTPERLTSSLVAGAYCGLVPCPAVSTIITTIVGFVFRLNQPVMQFMNQAVGVLQIVLLIPFIRLGERMFAEPPLPLSASQIIDMFKADWMQGFETLWTSLWHAIVAWLILAPVMFGLLYVVLKPVVRVLLARFARPAPVAIEPSRESLQG